MSSLDQLINTVAQRAVEREEASFMESQKNVVEIVRRGYDKWVELFLVLKAKKIGCYAYMAELLAGPEFRIKTNPDALRKAFAKVREERGQQRESVTRAPRGTDAEVHQNAQQLRYSSAGDGARSNPSPLPQVKRPGPVERLAATVTVPSETQPGGDPGGVVWTWDEDEPVFQGVKLKVFGGVPLVDKLKVIGRQVEEIAALWPLEDVRSTREFLVRYMEATGHQSMKNGDSYVEVNWPGYAVQLLDRLQDRLSLKQ